MIHSLTLRNFRAFKDQSFRFKRLNLFIGKNNSGKTTVLSALNVIAQTMKDQEIDGTPLVLNGSYDNLGTYIDVVNGNHPRRRIGIDIEIDEYTVKTEFKYRTQRRQIDLLSFDLSHKQRNVVKFQQRKDAYDISLMGESYEKLFPDSSKRRPRFRNFWPQRVTPLDYLPSLSRLSEPSTTAIREAERALARARRVFTEHFDRFDTVSPFRDRPQRTYLYSGETARQVGVSGSNAATMLAADASRRGSQKRSLIDNISKWFEYTGIAKGLTVESLTPRHFEICLVSNDGSKHNICDVGFGCSQVLPVLTAGLSLFNVDRSRRDSEVLVVQEPEIHLHPNAQAAMGSFFVSLVEDGGQAFVETHSDNLVLRVARHVAQGDISANDVAIFFVSDIGDDRVTNISITPEGGFEPPWPGGFFPQRQTESLLLARAAMRARVPTVVQEQGEFSYPASAL
jgi:predicted ATPase